MDQDQAAAAEFQMAFRKAAEDFFHAGPMSEAQRAAWANMYDVITSTNAGINMIGELARTKQALASTKQALMDLQKQKALEAASPPRNPDLLELTPVECVEVEQAVLEKKDP